MNNNPFDIFDDTLKEVKSGLEDLAAVAFPVIKLVGDICENFCPSYGHNSPEVVIREEVVIQEESEGIGQISDGINGLLSAAFGESVEPKPQSVEIIQLD